MLRPLRHALAGVGCLFAHASGAEIAPGGPEPYLAPLPAVATFATEQQIPLSGLALAPDRATPQPGDAVIALVTLYEGTRYRQWLLQLTVVALTPEEGKKRSQPMVIFSSTGNQLRFAGSPVALDLRSIGPFGSDRSGKPADAHARQLVNADFLGLGFDRASEALQRIDAAGRNAGGDIDLGFRNKPFPADVIGRVKQRAAELKISAEDERAMATTAPTLLAFFDVAQKTPSLEDILAEMLGKASLAWSAVTHGGKLEPSFSIEGAEPFDAARWSPDLPPAHRFSFTVALNKKPALETQFIVTAPRPPLLACAGIVGIFVDASGNKDKHLVIRVLAARFKAPDI